MKPRAQSTIGRGHRLAAIQTVADYRESVAGATPLTRPQRQRLIDQATIMIRDLYVHLPLKQAMHAVDPVQRLRLLDHRKDALDDPAFHEELLDIFIELRDLHTNYVLPDPYRGKLAFLGILLERYGDDDEPHWIVSKVFDHLTTEASLAEGVEVTHWNGTPIEDAVWRNADREAGSNLPARFARGLENLTFRSLASSLPPDEDWVDLRYVTATGEIEEARLTWQVYDSVNEILTGGTEPQDLLDSLRVPLRYQIGVDLRTETVRQAKKQLFAAPAVREAERVKGRSADRIRQTKAQKAANILPTTRPDELTARTVDTTSGQFGYLRLWTFAMADENIQAYLVEAIRLLDGLLPRNGLIIDARGNGGGYVIAAEFLLQLLTPRRITPEPSQFVTTDGTLDLTGSVGHMAPWRDSIAQATETASQYSVGIPLSDPGLVNLVGQVYHGPVVLITDAFCYSACDMFAAGFQDHEIGTIIGVDANTGAGGANVLTHAQLRTDWTDGPLESLPRQAQMRVALRRTLRVGANAGLPVEDLGVTPDELYTMSRDDLLSGNVDLLNRAGEVLAAGTPRQLDVTNLVSTDRDVTFDLATAEITNVDVYLRDRPVDTVDTPDGTRSVTVRKPSDAEAPIRLEGFRFGDLVAARDFTA
ncbi:MAG: S41 family peptidase [Actinomycetota bacterium]